MRKFFHILFAVLLPSGFMGQNWVVYDTLNSPIPHNTVLAVLCERNVKWIGTSLGLARFDGTNWEVYNTANSILPHNFIWSLEREDTILWIGTNTGLVRYDGQTWTLYDSMDHPNLGGILAISVDSTGNKWVGTANGLLMFDNSNWTLYHTSNSAIPGDHIKSIYCDTGNVTWIGTYNNGLGRFDGTSWLWYHSFNSGLINNRVWDIDKDEFGKFWFCTDEGISIFDGSSWISYDTSNSPLTINNNDVNNLVFENQNAWFATEMGVLKLDGLGLWTVYNTFNSSLPDTMTWPITKDFGNNIWIGTGGKGLAGYGNSLSVESNTDIIGYSRIFPNPSTGVVYLELNSGKSIVNLYNCHGVFLKAFVFYKTNSQFNNMILNDLADGLYLLEIINEEQCYDQKIILKK